MHSNSFSTDVLFLTSIKFNNSINELKDNLSFKFTLSKDFFQDLKEGEFEIILIDDEIFKDKKLLNDLKNLKHKGKVGIFSNNNSKDLSLDEILLKPININDLNNKIKNLLATRKYSENSSLKVKDYILDKNEKKFKKKDKFINVTEKEMQLIELLFFEKSSVSRAKILETIWHYSSEADTHTVETHIYRLRKKILEKFQDENLIINSKEGYTI